MYTFILIIHIITCVLLIAIVLLQAGKSFGLSGLMGGGTGDAVLTGAGGNKLLKRATLILAIVFMLTSLTLTSITAKNPNRSLMRNIMPPAPVIPDTEGIANRDRVVNYGDMEQDSQVPASSSASK